MSLDKSERLAVGRNLDFTIEWLEKVLLEEANLTAEDATLECWETKNVGAEKGFMSHIIKVALQWTGDHASLPTSVVVKLPTTAIISDFFADDAAHQMPSGIKEQLQDQMMQQFLSKMHVTELKFYDIFKGGPECAIAVPKVYHKALFDKNFQGGVIVMEDFSDGRIVRLTDGFRLEQVKATIDQLASLHAYTIRNTDWLEALEKPKLEEFDHFSLIIKDAANQLRKWKPDYFNENLSAIEHTFDAAFLYKNATDFEDLGLPPVLVHCDLWANNIIFEADDSQSNKAGDKLLAIVDWQGAKPGNLTEDLGRLMLSSCSSELRRKQQRNMLKYYYDALSKHFADNKAPFEFDAVVKAFDRIFPTITNVLIFGLPLWAKSFVVKGTDKDEATEELFSRGKAAIDDLVQLLENTKI